MNISEFAEQIVFGRTLEEKLMGPSNLTFERPQNQPSDRSLREPNRPAGLEMNHESGSSVQPPSDDQLEGEKERGQLLHFLANHELLATELMALVLLKFPDAPLAFRRGVLVTLQEEQEHTRMYLQRMKQCGIEFGQYPLSGHFWRSIEPMKTPMDFVSRLSLTFEQANLDYSLHFAKVFETIGDHESAVLLQQIYIDEISHVKHGLQWFRQWKDPEQSDWEAYQAMLDYPMSPQRGRGPRGAFNRVGRLEAGLNEEFVDAIEVYRQSRGRPPVVRWFDSGAEAELAGALSQKETSLLDRLTRDLELCLVPISRQDDILLVREIPGKATRKHLIDAGLEIPEFRLISDADELGKRKMDRCEPWSWTPTNHSAIASIASSFRVSPPAWQRRHVELFRKSWMSEKLAGWVRDDIRSGELPSCYTSEQAIGKVVWSLEEVNEAIEEFAERGFSNAIFKFDLGTSGRGQRRINCRSALDPQDENWLKKAFVGFSDESTEPVGVIEPELNRKIDLSLLWKLEPNSTKPNFLGWTRQYVTRGRRFAGTIFGNFSDCPSSLRQFLFSNRCERIKKLAEWIEAKLTQELLDRQFAGFFGVDTMICCDCANETNRDFKLDDWKLKPIIELNPRMTMGHIGLELGKKVAMGTPAEFRIFSHNECEGVLEHLNSVPLEFERDGRWKSGVILLGEKTPQTKLLPVMLVGEKALTIAGVSSAVFGSERNQS